MIESIIFEIAYQEFALRVSRQSVIRIASVNLARDGLGKEKKSPPDGRLLVERIQLYGLIKNTNALS